MLKLLIPALVAALVAGGAGFGASKFLPSRAPPPAPSAPVTPTAQDRHGKIEPAKPDKGAAKLQTMIELPPLVVGLTAPTGMWVRFEGTAVVEPMEAKAAQELRARLADDFLSYFAALSLPEVEGVVGLKSIREDLEERARLRSEGKVKEIVVQTLVAQ
jgi:flagellar FliL protein